MNSCVSEKEYNRFLENALSEEELTHLKDHVKLCAPCRAEFENWKVFREALLATCEIEVPKTLKSKVMEGVLKERFCHIQQPLSLRRKIAASALLLLLCGYYSLPYLKPYTDIILRETGSYLSELFYSMISFLGLDMKSVMSLFRVIIPLMNYLFWVFAISTLMLIAGFFLLIFKGRTPLKPNLRN